jgi:hypothetical protein
MNIGSSTVATSKERTHDILCQKVALPLNFSNVGYLDIHLIFSGADRNIVLGVVHLEEYLVT